MLNRPLRLMVATVLACMPAYAAELTLKVVDKAPPAELAAPVKDALQSKAVQLLDGDKPVVEFWFASAVTLKAKPEAGLKALEALPEVALLGAVQYHATQHDYRDDEITPGVYTMRYGLQPKDGNHLGTSEFNYYAILLPAAIDKTLEGFKGHEDMVKSSSTDRSADHPAILSLRPATSEPPLTIHAPVEDHKAFGVELPCKVDGADVKLGLDLVFKGMGHV